MRAYQNVALYCVLPDQDRKKHMKAHRKRMKEIKGVLTQKDLKFVPTHSPRNQDSSKISALRYGTEAVIARNNLVLAKRIFEIMEGPGIISDLMESDPNSHHPGTINFPQRLAEAKRIHNENLIIASRLDAVQPTYYDKSAVTAVRKGSPTKGKRPIPPRAQRPQQQGTRRSGPAPRQQAVEQGSRSEDKPAKSKNVLLEYSKIQKGKVLDVAVIKEPFRDCYSIFGIDIDNGQRYELKLTSEEVSTALEGDILVTSVDSAEVWMALISKVELMPVDAFSKTPLPNASHARVSNSETKKPTKPTTPNSSKNQNNNPRKNKIVKKECPVPSVTTATASSVGSSSAVAGADDTDDSSLTTGGGDDLDQYVVVDQESDKHFEREDDEEEDDEGEGYTLDEYYEDNAPLSPLPSQTGFVTSAPSGKQQRTFFTAASGGGGAPGIDEGLTSSVDKDKASVSDAASFAVRYILDTAVKNVLLHSSLPSVKQDGDGESVRKRKKADKPVPQPPSKSSTNPSPYTSTTVACAPRSHSITYKQVSPVKERHGDKAELKGLDNQSCQTPPTTPEGKSESVAKKDTIVKEPQQPKESAPTGGNRRPSNKQRLIVDTGGSKRKSSKAVSNARKPSQTLATADPNRKKSVAITQGRRAMSFRKQEALAVISNMPPKVADLAIKTALKRVGDILQLLDIKVPEN